MKRLLFFLILIPGFISVTAQDLIVTSSRDSINCKVKKVDQDNIYYSVNGQEEIIPLIKVKTCLYNFFLQKIPVTPEPAKQADQETPEPLVNKEAVYKRFRFAVDGGFGYRTFDAGSGLTSKLTKYYNKLKWGFNANAEFTYFFTDKRGAGIKTSVFKTSNSLDNVSLFVNGFLESGKIADDITIFYIGPAYTTVLLNDSNNSLLLNVSAGYARYANNMITISEYKLYGSTLGFALEIGYDRAVSNKLSVGVQGSVYGGTITKLTQEDSSGSTSFNYTESLIRFDLGIGIRF